MQKLTVVRSAYNPNQTYEEFKEARLLGFGGSDIGSLLNEGDYSCKRRLFMERLGLVLADDEGLRYHVERGKFFEGPVAELVAKKTGFDIRPCGTGYIKEFPFMRANADRLFWDDRNVTKGPGVLEIKCPGVHMFRKYKKEGLPNAYLLQLQWQMLCYGTTHGMFAIFCAETFELELFPIERDEEMIQGLIRRAKEGWEELQYLLGVGLALSDSQLPEKLDSHSKACERCPAYAQCHGVKDEAGETVEIPDLAGLAMEMHTWKIKAKTAEDEANACKANIIRRLQEVGTMKAKAGNYIVKLSERSRETISSKVKEVLTPEQLVSYTKHSTYEVLDVKEV